MGVNETIVGKTLNDAFAPPKGVETKIWPLIASTGMVAVIWVSEFITKIALTGITGELNFTAVAPVKFAPVITISVPDDPNVGVIEEIQGPTLKEFELVVV